MAKQMTKKQKDALKYQLAHVLGFGERCWWGTYCSSSNVFTLDELTLDHLIPQSKGGSNNPENLRLACLCCNRSRGNSLFPPPQKYRSSSLNNSNK
ncbi:HNH endonuclease [Pseudanabaena sp. 'Roaring Creek']|uniref:HNH endonuclease n=1 Tax=Pseudanabaena sp. 'Roaring Creek' TaxID=1681830 RepID=UPI000A3F4D25|nr:HNH endonuclease [Pseudanabaena sp. 'Roaring Creek']